jgi:hypothetical protein
MLYLSPKWDWRINPESKSIQLTAADEYMNLPMFAKNPRGLRAAAFLNPAAIKKQISGLQFLQAHFKMVTTMRCFNG